MQSQATGFSIIIPTYREVKNLPALITRLASALTNHAPFELILMDDNSQDGTTELIASLAPTHPWLRLIQHQGERSWAGSVLQGIQAATYPLLVFMDADLSHPPEMIPAMLLALQQTPTELVIGSRYMKGGSIDKKWPLYRQLISRLSTLVIKPLLPVKINDPLSGFIATQKRFYTSHGQTWNPIGTKLALEMIIKSHLKHIQEIPIHFAEREHGESKLLNKKVMLNYLTQVKQLWQYKLIQLVK